MEQNKKESLMEIIERQGISISEMEEWEEMEGDVFEYGTNEENQ